MIDILMMRMVSFLSVFYMVTMIREDILNAKLITITFIFSSFANVFDLPDCTSTLILKMMTAIMIVIC